FFFSSRRRHTRLQGDWSSDVCSSDLNPHIRTGVFAIGRELLLALDLPEVPDKPSAYRLESGVRGITRRVQDRGLRAVVVGRDGQIGRASCRERGGGGGGAEGWEGTAE